MRIIINSVLIVLIGITCGCRNTEKYDHQEKVDLYSYRYQHLYGVTIYDDRLITITKETIQPFKDLISVNLHDMEGNILKTDNYEISNSSSFEVFIHDSQAAAGWVQHEVLNSNDYLWIVAEENKILRRQLILSEKFGFLPNTSLNEDLGKEYFILGRWWLLEIAGRKILFVEKKGTKLDNIKNGPDFIDKLWIYKYALNDDDIQLEGRCCINNDFVRSGRSEIECAAEGDKVYIWICADSDDIRCNTLKVAEWENKEELNWIDCYISKNPLHE